MARSYHIFIWKEAPFLRLLIPVITGIVTGFYCKIEIAAILNGSAVVIALFILFALLPEAARYHLRWIQGIFIFILLAFLGSFITWQKEVRHHPNWYGKYVDTGSFVVATIQEPPVEKAKSFKALVTIETIINKEVHVGLEGKALIYFAKDSASAKLNYGDKIIFGKPLQEIINSGNPGAFDYKQYCAFQQIYQQVYLKTNEWEKLKEKDASFFKVIIFKTRDYILETLDKYIPRAEESSLAKALLIGYRVDLDKDLVQAYSNTGVVHLIAISGMHLALIYFFLVWIFARIPFIKKSKTTRLVFILFCLWFFALLTGAPASVLRSAVMFTFIAIGQSFNRRNSIYNSLAVSALVLLCYDPFMLWGVGFQLSYLAVLGIVISQKYIYNWFYFKNKLMSEVWELISISLAAQVLTLPVCIYYFHQLPLLFLLANVIAIPLSTLILGGCIALVAISPIPIVAMYLGELIWAFIWLLNLSILTINAIPFSLWNGLSISVTGTILLYFIFILFLYWLIKRNKLSLKLAISATIFFTGTIAYKNWKSIHQKKIIVYNIPQHSAVDFIRGNQYHFIGDSDVIENNLVRNYNIKPTHILLMLDSWSSLRGIFYRDNNFYQFYNSRILLIDSALAYSRPAQKMKIDYIILSKNERSSIADIAEVFDCNSYIFDASNSLWKIDQWKKECEELHLQFHSVSGQGAFVTNL